MAIASGTDAIAGLKAEATARIQQLVDDVGKDMLELARRARESYRDLQEAMGTLEASAQRGHPPVEFKIVDRDHPHG